MDDNSEGVLKIFLDTVDIDEKTDTRFSEIHPGKYIELTVKDSGKGIAPDIRERIFVFVQDDACDGSSLCL